MAKPCTVCVHPERQAIDSAIVANAPVGEIEKRLHVSRHALKRHRAHVIELVAKSPKVQEIAQADGIVGEILDLQALMQNTLDVAIKEKDKKTMFAAFDRLVGILKLRSEISGELKPRQTNNLYVHLGGQKGFHEQLEQLIDRARFFPPERVGPDKALPIDVGT
jgi:hypothetical protein